MVSRSPINFKVFPRRPKDARVKLISLLALLSLLVLLILFILFALLVLLVNRFVTLIRFFVTIVWWPPGMAPPPWLPRLCRQWGVHPRLPFGSFPPNNNWFGQLELQSLEACLEKFPQTSIPSLRLIQRVKLEVCAAHHRQMRSVQQRLRQCQEGKQGWRVIDPQSLLRMVSNYMQIAGIIIVWWFLFWWH